MPKTDRKEYPENIGIKINIPDIDKLTTFLITGANKSADMTLPEVQDELVKNLIGKKTETERTWFINPDNSLLNDITFTFTSNYYADEGANIRLECGLSFTQVKDSFAIARRTKQIKDNLKGMSVKRKKNKDGLRKLIITTDISSIPVNISIGYKTPEQLAKVEGDDKDVTLYGNNPLIIDIDSASTKKDELAAQIRSFAKITEATINSFYKVLNQQAPDSTIDLSI